MEKPFATFVPFGGLSCMKHGWGSAAVRIEGFPRDAREGYYCGACFVDLIAAHCSKVGYLEAPAKQAAADE